MSFRKATIVQYHKQAEALRVKAFQERNASKRDLLLEIATEFEDVAQGLERQMALLQR